MCVLPDYVTPTIEEVEICLACQMEECDDQSPACPWRASVYAKREEYRLRYLRENESADFRAERNRKRKLYYQRHLEQFREYFREYKRAQTEHRERRRVKLAGGGGV